MKRILVGGLVTALAAGGLGFTTGGSASANPLSGSAAGSGTAICSLLPALCPSTPTPTTGGSLADALEALAGAGSSATPAQLAAVVDQLQGTGLPTSTLQTVVTQVVDQLQSGAAGWPAGVLDGDMIAAAIGQVVAQLPAGAAPTDVPGVVDELIGSVQELVTAIVGSLTGSGSGVPSGTAVSDLATALLAGDASATTTALRSLAGSLDASALRDLVADLVDALGLLGGSGGDLSPTELRALLTSLVDAVVDAAQGGGLSTVRVQALLTGLVDGLTRPGATDPFGPVTTIVTQLITRLETFGSSTTTIIERLIPISGPTTPAPGGPTAGPTGSRARLATPSVSVGRYSTTKRPVFAGRGTPGATVAVRTTAGRLLATARVAGNGTWRARSAPKLKRAAYRVAARQSARGRTTSASSAARSFRVVSAKPRLTGKKTTRAHRPMIKGIGYPGARIVVRTKGGSVLARTRVKADGTFKVRSTKRLADGRYKTRATQKRNGQVLRSPYRTIRVR